jgi:hypothetical protein
MHKLSIAAVALLSCVMAGALSAAVEEGDVGPNFAFDKSWNTPEGFKDLDAYRGKIVMVERWATW